MPNSLHSPDAATATEGNRSAAALPRVLTSPLLARHGFAHAFSTRAFDLHPAHAGYAENLARFAEAAGFDAAHIRQAKQVHGIAVARADELPRPTEPATLEGEADAWVTTPGRGDVVGVRVADCMPILVGAFEDRDAAGTRRRPRAAAAIHAGWLGFARGVIQATMAELERVAPGARRVAAIGPCIGACCFEVDQDVADQIVGAAGTDAIVARRVGVKTFLDLRLGARLALRAAGIEDTAIEDVPGCTVCDAARLFSYRRERDASGRHLALIRADGEGDGAT